MHHWHINNFETGDLSKWNGQLTAVDGGDLSVTASAAQAGAFGLQALIDDTVVLKAVDSTPADEQHYRARFYFHPNSLVMAANTSHYIFDGYDTYHGSNPFRLELFYESGAYKLRSRAMKDDWSYNSSSKYTLSNAWHYVEIEWQASTGANNGFLSLWIDGTLVETLSALDNDDTAGWLDEVRLGATNGLDSTTSGSMRFDHFESRRNTYIGPVSTGPTNTPTPTATASVTPTASKTSTPSQTPSATSTPTKTFTPSVTATPSKTSTPSQTPTKTSTPSATPTHTPTASNTPSPTPTASGGGSISVNASFQYDGDGRRVSQTINPSTGSGQAVTTYFVGNYYEQTGSTVTKYYYAGSQRVAMRANGTLYFLLGDHLGSTSLTTNDSGNVISEMRYTPWGEVRYNAGVTPTDYTYTGQKSYAGSFGLAFYNARWYDSSIGRFAQADTIVPSGVQGLDRYAYVNNSPLNFVDPSGHVPQCDGDGWCGDQNSEYTGGDANIGNYTDGNSDNSTSEDWEDSHCPPGQTDCNVYEYGWPTNEEIDYIQWLIRDAESKLAGSTAFNTIIGKGPLEKWILGWQGLEIFRLEEMNNSIFQPVKQSLADPSNHVEMAVFKSNETYGIKSVSYTITKSDGSVESTTYTPDSLFTTVLVNLLEGRRTDIYLPNP